MKRRLELVRAWDVAWTEKKSGAAPDYTVGVLMGSDPQSDVLYVLDVVRERLSPAELERALISTAACDGEACHIRIPRDPGAGRFVAAYMAQKLQGYTVSIEPEHTSKIQRAAPLASQAENRFLVLLKADWNAAFIEELCAFPNGVNDDQVDAAAAAFRALVRRPQWDAVGA